MEENMATYIINELQKQNEDYKRVALEYKKGNKRKFIVIMILLISFLGMTIYNLILLDSMNDDIGIIQKEVEEIHD